MSQQVQPTYHQPMPGQQISDAGYAIRRLSARLTTIGLLGLVLLGWAGAEAHDANCYSKATVETLSRIGSNEDTPRSDCLILPWNDPD